MTKYTVKLEYLEDNYYWNDDSWKDFVCQDFDENVVMLGNRDYSEITEASWFKDACELVDELDNYDDSLEDLIDAYGDDYAADKLEDVYNAYQDCDRSDDPEFLIKVAKILYPHLDLVYTTIRGSNQGDWQDVIYVSGCLDEGILADWYFGNVYDANLYVRDEPLEDYDEDDYGEHDTSAVITDTEYWNMKHDFGSVEKGFAELFGVPVDEITVIED